MRQVVAPVAITGTLAGDSTLLRQLETMSQLALNSGDVDSTLAITARTFAIIERFQPQDLEQVFTRERLLKAYRRQGLALFDSDEYPEALASYLRYQHYAKELDYPLQVGASYHMMAACFREMLDTASALVNARKAIAVLRGAEPGKELAEAYMGMGGLWTNMTRPDSAAYWIQQAIPIYRKAGSVNKEGACYLNLVELYLNHFNADSATKYMRLASIVEERWKGTASMGPYLGLKANVALLRGEFAEADRLAREAERLVQGSSSNLYRVFYVRALTHAGLQHGDSAHLMLKRAQALMQEDLGLEKARAMTKLQMQAEKDKEAAMAAEQLAAEQMKKRYALLGVGLVSALCLALFFFFRNSRRTARILAAKNTEILLAQERLVVSEKQREAEQVRTRIARDIHDELGSELTKITLLGNEAKRLLLTEPGNATAAIDRMRGLSRELGASFSDIVWAVDPESDSVQGLLDHARVFTQRQMDGTGIGFEPRFEHTGLDRPIDPATKRDIFLVLKEALNNALKYAEAKHIGVQLLTSATDFELLVRDDGIGYAREERAASGRGLTNLGRRAERLGARLTIASAPGKGTSVDLAGRFA